MATAVIVGCAATGSPVPVAQTVVESSPKPVQARPARSAAADRLKDHFPNIQLQTQNGKPVRFYDDLVKDRIVLVYFMFTACEGICPATTANMVRVQDLLGDRFGRDIFFIAVTLTPAMDTPDVLKEYADAYGTKPGWTFVTGDRDEIEMLRRKMGVYDPDPVVDADLYSHAGLVTFGNESTGKWSALPGTMNAEEITRTILRRTRTRPQRP